MSDAAALPTGGSDFVKRVTWEEQAMMERRIGHTTVRLVTGDITQLDVDGFVFDITEDAKLGAGIGAAIQQRGGVAIQKALDAIGRIGPCEAVATEAGLLPAEWIIHTNGPKFREEDEDGKLRRATQAALERAEERGVRRLAIPPLGTGLYQVPVDLCATAMVDTIQAHLRNGSTLDEVVIVAPDPREYVPFHDRLEEGA